MKQWVGPCTPLAPGPLPLRWRSNIAALLRLGEKATVAAELTRSRGRWLELKGELRDDEGNLLAQSKGIFVRLPEEEASALETLYLAQPREISKVDD